MIPLNLDALMSALRKSGHEAQIQKETNQVYFIIKEIQREFPLFIRIYEKGDLLQLLTFLPCHLKPESTASLARLLHLLNKELDIPGFGMDEASGTLFFRCVIATPLKTIEEVLLNTYIKTITLACKTFSPAIEVAASGKMSFEEILKKVKDGVK